MQKKYNKYSDNIRIYFKDKIINNISLLRSDKFMANDIFYLKNVMRKNIGDNIYIFNEYDGEFLFTINQLSDKICNLSLIKKISEVKNKDNNFILTLAVSMTKSPKFTHIIDNATQMNIDNIIPLIYENSVITKLDINKLKITAKSASEQCKRFNLAKIYNICNIYDIFNKQKDDQLILICNENIAYSKFSFFINKIKSENDLKKYKEIIIIIGPEGGFSNNEINFFLTKENCNNIYNISLNNNILRVDTAVITAINNVKNFF